MFRGKVDLPITSSLFYLKTKPNSKACKKGNEISLMLFDENLPGN